VIFPSLRDFFWVSHSSQLLVRNRKNKKISGATKVLPKRDLKKEVVEMKELNVISELFPQHMLDRFREKAVEEAKEEERQDSAHEFEFEGVRE
jgi:hypothetical protein